MDAPTLAHWDGQTWGRYEGQVQGNLVGMGRAGHETAWLLQATNPPLAFEQVGDTLVPTHPQTVAGSRFTVLTGIAGVSTLDVWAVGYATFAAGRPDQPVIEHWNGTAWALVPSPALGAGAHRLAAVTTLAAGDVWAVGASAGDALVEHWDGHTWTVVAAPAGAGLVAVAAYDAQDVWVSGAQLAHWDGHAWATVAGVAAPPRQASGAGGENGSPGLNVVGPEEVWWFAAGLVRVADPCRTPVVCPVPFSDVPLHSPFYNALACAVCHNLVSGYADGTFRPAANITRGQGAKLVAGAAGYADAIPAGRQTFADVPPGQPFWVAVERATRHAVISGYGCGGPGEPCDAQRRPYFRPAGSLTRAQAAKIVAAAAGYHDAIPSDQHTFRDVSPPQPFWRYIEQLVAYGIVSGYADGTYRPGATVTRGQFAKLVGAAFFPSCYWLGSP